MVIKDCWENEDGVQNETFQKKRGGEREKKKRKFESRKIYVLVGICVVKNLLSTYFISKQVFPTAPSLQGRWCVFEFQLKNEAHGICFSERENSPYADTFHLHITFA